MQLLAISPTIMKKFQKSLISLLQSEANCIALISDYHSLLWATLNCTGLSFRNQSALFLLFSDLFWGVMCNLMWNSIAILSFGVYQNVCKRANIFWHETSMWFLRRKETKEFISNCRSPLGILPLLLLEYWLWGAWSMLYQMVSSSSRLIDPVSPLNPLPWFQNIRCGK